MNGKIFEIHHRPMPDGGWVGPHADVTLQRQTEARITHMAHHDALTGLANRLQLTEWLEAALTRTPPGKPVALLLLDLDNF
jgi:GGDEF domain-containing protein